MSGAIVLDLHSYSPAERAHIISVMRRDEKLRGEIKCQLTDQLRADLVTMNRQRLFQNDYPLGGNTCPRCVERLNTFSDTGSGKACPQCTEIVCKRCRVLFARQQSDNVQSLLLALNRNPKWICTFCYKVLQITILEAQFAPSAVPKVPTDCGGKMAASAQSDPRRLDEKKMVVAARADVEQGAAKGNRLLTKAIIPNIKVTPSTDELSKTVQRLVGGGGNRPTPLLLVQEEAEVFYTPMQSPSDLPPPAETMSALAAGFDRADGVPEPPKSTSIELPLTQPLATVERRSAWIAEQQYSSLDGGFRGIERNAGQLAYSIRYDTERRQILFRIIACRNLPLVPSDGQERAPNAYIKVKLMPDTPLRHDGIVADGPFCSRRYPTPSATAHRVEQRNDWPVMRYETRQTYRTTAPEFNEEMRLPRHQSPAVMEAQHRYLQLTVKHKESTWRESKKWLIGETFIEIRQSAIAPAVSSAVAASKLTEAKWIDLLNRVGS